MRHRNRRDGERGQVILLVALILLFVVGAMAALAIDLVSFYTARSEAQLAADSGALAGARVLANSGTTSSPADTGLFSDAKLNAERTAMLATIANKVGGSLLNGGNVTAVASNQGPNPQITVRVQKADLPTFFAKIWGRTTGSVSASATAEAYNPSGLNATPGARPPVATSCVKPWLLPNLNPAPSGGAIFDVNTGEIKAADLLGWKDPGTPTNTFYARCGSCPTTLPGSATWRYYPGANSSFPAPPNQSLPQCNVVLNTNYMKSVAGCVRTPITCNSDVNIDTTPYPGFRNQDTGRAVNCLTHTVNNQGDSVEDSPPNQSFQFLGGADNPIASANNQSILVSDSLVTVPVFDSPPTPFTSPVRVIGFVQLFLNSDGTAASVGVNPGRLKTTVVNLVGCGRNATGTPIFGNGASPVAVRLISPSP